MSYQKKLYNWMKRADAHGHNIGLTYNNKHASQSFIGGIITLISRLGIIVYFMVLVSFIVKK